MSSDDDLAIALSVIFGVFFLAAALIVAYFVLKYYNRRSSYDVTGEYHNNPAFRDDDDDTVGPGRGRGGGGMIGEEDGG